MRQRDGSRLTCSFPRQSSPLLTSCTLRSSGFPVSFEKCLCSRNRRPIEPKQSRVFTRRRCASLFSPHGVPRKGKFSASPENLPRSSGIDRTEDDLGEIIAVGGSSGRRRRDGACDATKMTKTTTIGSKGRRAAVGW